MLSIMGWSHLQNERQKSKLTNDGRSDADIQEAATLLTYDDLENFQPVKIPEEHIKVYRKEGGTPHLDMQYTVFGEVVEGMDIVDRIAGVQTDENNKPVNDVIIIKASIVRR